MGCKSRNPKNPQFSDHCFTGDYPIDVSEIIKTKYNNVKKK